MTIQGKPSDLQIHLARQVLENLAARGSQSGEHVSEAKFAEQLGVSRSPIRSALELLEARAILVKEPNRGYFLTKDAASLESDILDLPDSSEDELYRTIAADRLAGELAEHVSEADLLRRYQTTRGVLKRVLQRLSDDNLIDRAPGHGWRFQPALLTEDAHDESYAFRLLIEPASFDQPTFKVDEVALAQARMKHQKLIESADEVSIRNLVEMNADFHEMLAAFSNNRYILSAMQSQNRLRRLMEINGLVAPERVKQSCEEHLEIITALEHGDVALAQVLLRRHLTIASRLKLAFSP